MIWGTKMFKMYKEEFSIADLLKLYNELSLDLSPRYQRTGGIWKRKDNQLLMDSIFNEIDLPKFYFHLFPKGGNRSYQYAVIDGKQRILAIIAFYNNEYPLSKEFQMWEGNMRSDIAGMYYKDISENYPLLAGTFLDFKIDITVIDSDDADRIDNMFIRINKGVRVNPAEQRNAHGGELIDRIANACARSKFFNKTVTFKDDRKAFQELYLKIFLLEQEGKIVTLGDNYINGVLEKRKNCLNGEVIIINRIFETLEKISDRFGNRESIFKKNNVILYYWFLKEKINDEDQIVEFVRHFESQRLKQMDMDPDYLRFNELTRQGIYQGPKMEERLDILESKLNYWKECNR